MKNQPNTFILKIANQQYISDYRIDKNGEVYWKFREVEQESEIVKDPSSNSTPPSLELDPITKFQQRQEKSEKINNYGKPTNNSQQSESVSS